MHVRFPFRQRTQWLWGFARSAVMAACISWLPLSAEEAAPAHGIFEANMDRIFADGRADIRVVFGYDNYEGIKEPNDPARSQHFMRYLVKRSFAPIAPSPELAKSLGVSEEALNMNIRAFGGMTVDGRRMRVALIWSSLTNSTAKNIGVDSVKQHKWSQVALAFMKKACAESEVMIYVGHSRGGGGPDTFPPEILTGPNVRSQQVDFAWYRRNRPGMVALEPTFAKAENTPSFLVWTGCQAHQHFGGWLTNLLGGKDHSTSLVLSTRLTNHIPGAPNIVDTDESVMAAAAMMEALIFRESQSQLEKRLLDCEIPEKWDPSKPLWKITNLAGKAPALATTPVAATAE